MKQLYRVQVEVEHMEGTQLPDDCAGAFVNVYLASSNIVDAIRAVEAELLKDCYRPVNTYAAYELDLEDEDFDTDEEGYPGNSDLLNLLETGDIWYGPFNCFPPDEQQLQ